MQVHTSPIGMLKSASLPHCILLFNHDLTLLIGEERELILWTLIFNMKTQDCDVKREAFLKVRNAQFWDERVKFHQTSFSTTIFHLARSHLLGHHRTALVPHHSCSGTSAAIIPRL